MNVFPNIINNLISLTRDSKFGVKEAKSLMDVNSFNLLLNSKECIAYSLMLLNKMIKFQIFQLYFTDIHDRILVDI